MPDRTRRTRVLIVGCGDIGLRIAAALVPALRLMALTSSPTRCELLRAHGVQPLLGNLDDPQTLTRLAGLADRIIYLAPPHSDGATDIRCLAFLRAISRRSPPVRLVYASTSGVYGDCGGAWIDETQPLKATTPRAMRRVDAEQQVRLLGRRLTTSVSILRIPGIYAPDRPDVTPRERLLAGTPVLLAQDDVYTNHIHADDLARACIAALWRGRSQRVYHVSDDTELKLGDYMDLAADLYKLPRPPRLDRAELQKQISPMRLSFMAESRRLRNARMKRELRVTLRYPTVRQGLR